MTMELGGKVSIVCSKTGYSCELEFKLRVSCIFGGKIREGVRGVATVFFKPAVGRHGGSAVWCCGKRIGQ